MNEPNNAARRTFLKQAGATGAVAAAAATCGCAQTAQRDSDLAAQAPAYVFFTPDEAAFVVAAVDTFIPKDEVGPGGVETGVVVFIDRQLAGPYGQSARQYVLGPFAQGTPEQGYQVALTPAEFYRLGIPDVDAYCRKTLGGRTFAALTPAERDAVLKAMRDGKVDLPDVPARAFLSLLFNDAVAGYFADPIYGGNRGKAGWAMIGFPGPFRIYSGEIDQYRGRRYAAAPKSIADLT